MLTITEHNYIVRARWELNPTHPVTSPCGRKPEYLGQNPGLSAEHWLFSRNLTGWTHDSRNERHVLRQWPNSSLSLNVYMFMVPVLEHLGCIEHNTILIPVLTCLDPVWKTATTKRASHAWNTHHAGTCSCHCCWRARIKASFWRMWRLWVIGIASRY